MYNWNINISKLKRDPDKYNIWKLEQSINFGLNGQKIKASELKKYWRELNIDPQRKKLFEVWLWPKQF